MDAANAPADGFDGQAWELGVVAPDGLVSVDAAALALPMQGECEK